MCPRLALTDVKPVNVPVPPGMTVMRSAMRRQGSIGIALSQL